MFQENFKRCNPDKECPSNLGKKWSREEEYLLLEELNENMDINIIAEKHKRTYNSICSRQKEIAYKMFILDISITEIMNKTKLNEIQIREFIEKKYKQISVSKIIKEAKKETKLEAKKHKQISVSKYIKEERKETKLETKNQRSMEDVIFELKEETMEMRDEINGLKKNIKELVEMMTAVYEFEDS